MELCVYKERYTVLYSNPHDAIYAQVSLLEKRRSQMFMQFVAVLMEVSPSDWSWRFAILINIDAFKHRNNCNIWMHIPYLVLFKYVYDPEKMTWESPQSSSSSSSIAFWYRDIWIGNMMGRQRHVSYKILTSTTRIWTIATGCLHSVVTANYVYIYIYIYKRIYTFKTHRKTP